MKRKKYLSDSEIQWEELGGGVSRKFFGYDNQIMMVKVKFEKGALGSPHQHFHTQTTYCAKGKFEFTVGDEKYIVEVGDGIYVEPNLMHGARCLEEGILIDVFSPVREDFLDGSDVTYFEDKK